MDFSNETKLESGWTIGFQNDGREILVVVVKATFDILKFEKDVPILAKQQLPLVEADEFSGEPGFSATIYETDYAHKKLFCDVLLNGSAYARKGEEAVSTKVSIKAGSMYKEFEVCGNRVWDKSIISIKPTKPQPFSQIPISYNNAYGGTDIFSQNPENIKTYPTNPVGIGYYPLTKGKGLIGKPLANTYEIGKRTFSAKGKYIPMSFGAVARNIKSRYQFAGTYDKKWLEEKVPFFPDDFDYKYFQVAPIDQQIPYPKGGELVELINLSENNYIKFKIPNISVPILFVPYKYKTFQQKPVIDTILIEPDQNRCMITMRTTYPLKKNYFEIKQVIVGGSIRSHTRKNNQQYKRKFKNLHELILAKKRNEF